MTPTSHREPRTLAILGASGGTGKQLVKYAIAAGHHVVAIVRDPAKLDLVHERIRVERADVTDAENLRPHLEGADAVLSALGPTGGDVCTRAMSAVQDAMDDVTGVRVIAISAQPLGRDNGEQAWWHRLVLIPVLRMVYRAEYADLARMEEVLRAGAANWSVLRPPYLTDDAELGTYRVRADASPPRSVSITRADLARAMLDILDDPATYRRALGIGSP